jgi:DNA-directed RNA polymerase alpha subunit
VFDGAVKGDGEGTPEEEEAPPEESPEEATTPEERVPENNPFYQVYRYYSSQYPTNTEEQERLIMEVESDGSTSPKDAINHSASVARQHLGFFMFNEAESIKAVNEEEINEALEGKSLLLKSIDEMELSVRSHNCLQAAGIVTIGEYPFQNEGSFLQVFVATLLKIFFRNFYTLTLFLHL